MRGLALTFSFFMFGCAGPIVIKSSGNHEYLSMRDYGGIFERDKVKLGSFGKKADIASFPEDFTQISRNQKVWNIEILTKYELFDVLFGFLPFYQSRAVEIYHVKK